ncbi:MAG: hypothetical protein IJU23_07320 [Proteobacteria bacterium]|nr:hypothetical protein [Pseudomonadota bacterium]
MSNPFRKADALRRFFAILVIITFSFSFCPAAMAQGDFDFSDDSGDDVGGNDFDFADDTPPTPLQLDKKFVMPNNGKPVNLVLFDPVDGTPQRTLDQLTEATVDLLKDEKYAQYDSVEGIPIEEKLAAMGDDRFDCLNDPVCITDMGREIGAANIIIGTISTEGQERPQVTLDLYEVSTSSKKNSIFFETQNRLRKQEQDISGALIRLFNIDTGDIDSLLTKRQVEESAPLPLGQLISGIVVGVVALGAIGTGIYFGVTAKKIDSDVGDAIEFNRVRKENAEDFNAVKSEGKTQVSVKDDYDKASKYAMIANIMYASGAVLAVVSVILFLVRSDKNDDIFANDLYISPSIGQDGAGVVTGFSF